MKSLWKWFPISTLLPPRIAPVVFVNGCFDIFHVGHVGLLEYASERGSSLIVGINSDESVRELKGPTRPINSVEDRAVVLCAIGCVDCVTMFHEDTPAKLLSLIAPQVWVKGGEYGEKGLLPDEQIVVNHLGIKVLFCPMRKGLSSTEILAKI